MKQDIILAGVGGQGILSIAFVIDNAALADGLTFKQAEVHGMAQRGGAVQSHLRLSDGTIWSDLIPKGEADLILSVEPLEALRYMDHLRPDGVIVTSSTPYKNIPDYPDVAEVLEAVRRAPKSVIIDAEALAKEAGTAKAQNIVLLGAAAPVLMLKEQSLLATIDSLFRGRGLPILEANLKAFALGKKAALGS
ncbi:MAG TPA: indolepyruvate oxidoreductase subunit beta [Candidatus Aminicenantes bacterium]|nr:indolepyruvate oxidoreductase subunit beta [Candidatus Aminicenantes bacterium]HRY65401.1 indolepyruvate oxidoreductase subunit beta [Candidatus Aminicenantes bacterium]HRZ72131.1 indolepyruvate oxidoreductase subunit beta [Candidatus Aminicenantes bacterium]